MQQSRGNLVLSSLALAVACFSLFLSWQNSQLADTSVQSTPQMPTQLPINNISPDTTNIQNWREIQLKIQALEAKFDANQLTDSQIKNQIAAVLKEQELEDIEKHRQENPIYGFYHDLPDNYENRLKTDQNYAETTIANLRQKVTNSQLDINERLAAFGQLQMSQGILNQFAPAQSDSEISSALIQMSRLTTEETQRIQIIEMITQFPHPDHQTTEMLIDLIDKDSNHYVRNLAMEGLVFQYMTADQFESSSNKSKLAQKVLELISNKNDTFYNKLKNDKELMQQLQKDALE